MENWEYCPTCFCPVIDGESCAGCRLLADAHEKSASTAASRRAEFFLGLLVAALTILGLAFGAWAWRMGGL